MEKSIGNDWALLVRLVKVEVMVHEELAERICQVRIKIELRVGHVRWRDENLPCYADFYDCMGRYLIVLLSFTQK